MEQDVSVFSDMMQLNYMGTVHVLKAALPRLVQRGEGRVVLVASVMAVIGAHSALPWQDRGSLTGTSSAGSTAHVADVNVLLQASQGTPRTHRQSGLCAGCATASETRSARQLRSVMPAL